MQYKANVQTANQEWYGRISLFLSALAIALGVSGCGIDDGKSGADKKPGDVRISVDPGTVAIQKLGFDPWLAVKIVKKSGSRTSWAIEQVTIDPVSNQNPLNNHLSEVGEIECVLEVMQESLGYRKEWPLRFTTIAYWDSFDGKGGGGSKDVPLDEQLVQFKCAAGLDLVLTLRTSNDKVLQTVRLKKYTRGRDFADYRKEYISNVAKIYAEYDACYHLYNYREHHEQGHDRGAIDRFKDVSAAELAVLELEAKSAVDQLKSVARGEIAYLEKHPDMIKSILYDIYYNGGHFGAKSTFVLYPK